MLKILTIIPVIFVKHPVHGSGYAFHGHSDQLMTNLFVDRYRNSNLGLNSCLRSSILHLENCVDQATTEG